jgi:hypothetical protein
MLLAFLLAFMAVKFTAGRVRGNRARFWNREGSCISKLLPTIISLIQTATTGISPILIVAVEERSCNAGNQFQKESKIMLNSRMSRLFMIVTVMLVFATAAYAFAAANTVPATVAGDGSGAISGYTVSAVVYNLNTTTPSNIDSVDFTLSGAASTVKIGLGGGFYDCTNASGNDWTCTTTGAAVAPATTLEVIAKNN